MTERKERLMQHRKSVVEEQKNGLSTCRTENRFTKWKT